MAGYSYDVINDIEAFRTEHGVAQFTAHDGIVMLPNSMNNRRYALPYTAVLENVKYIDVLKKLGGGMETLAKAVMHFMDLNDIRYSMEDDEAFMHHLVLLAHFMHRYLRYTMRIEVDETIEVGEVQQMPRRYSGPDGYTKGYEARPGQHTSRLTEYMTKSQVDRMYNDLYEHLLRTRHLSRWTAKSVLFGKDGLQNTLQILNEYQETIRRKNERFNTGYPSGSPKREDYQSAEKLRTELIDDVKRLRNQNMTQFIKDIGNAMEGHIMPNKRRIIKEVQVRNGFHAHHAKLFALDGDLAVNKYFGAGKRGRCPDFMYADSNGNIVGVDATMTTASASGKKTQVAKETLKRAMTELGYPPQLVR